MRVGRGRKRTQLPITKPTGPPCPDCGQRMSSPAHVRYSPSITGPTIRRYYECACTGKIRRVCTVERIASSTLVPI